MVLGIDSADDESLPQRFLNFLCCRTPPSLPVHPKSEDELRRLEKATEHVALFSGSHGAHGGHFSVGCDHKVELKQALFLAMEPMQCQAGEDVIRQGERGDKFYVIESGEYEVRLRQKNDAVVFRYADEGSFGELALLSGHPRASTVHCNVGGRLWTLDRETFRTAFVNHGHPDPTVKFAKAVHKVTHALDEATKHGLKSVADGMHAVTATPGHLHHAELESLLHHIMPPGLTQADIAELKRKCMTQLDGGAEEISLKEIAAALVAAGANDSDESKKILRTKDLVFRAWHDGKSRQEVMLETLEQARTFYQLSPLLILLQGGYLAITAVQARQSAVATGWAGAPEIAGLACCAIMFVATLIGIPGVWRLRSDLDADADGHGSTAQHALEIFFWFVSILSVATFALSVFDLVSLLNGHADTALRHEASRFPETFIEMARQLRIDPTPNTGSVDAVQRTHSYLKIAGVAIASVHLCLAVKAAWCVAKIVTFLEIMRDLVRCLSVLNAILVLGLIFLAGQGLALVLILFTLNGVPPVVFAAITAASTALLLLFMVVPATMQGLLAAHHEDIVKLKRFQRSATFVACCALAAGLGILLSLPPRIDEHIQLNCRTVMQSVPEAWLATLPPNVGCQKYYGRALRVDADGGLFLDNRSSHVGSLTTCLRPNDRALAWEYPDDDHETEMTAELRSQVPIAGWTEHLTDEGIKFYHHVDSGDTAWEEPEAVRVAKECAGDGLYACLNDDCCESLRTSVAFYFIMLGVDCVAIAVSFLLAAMGAHDLVHRFFSNPALTHLVNKCNCRASTP